MIDTRIGRTTIRVSRAQSMGAGRMSGDGEETPGLIPRRAPIVETPSFMPGRAPVVETPALMPGSTSRRAQVRDLSRCGAGRGRAEARGLARPDVLPALQTLNAHQWGPGGKKKEDAHPCRCPEVHHGHRCEHLPDDSLLCGSMNCIRRSMPPLSRCGGAPLRR